MLLPLSLWFAFCCALVAGNGIAHLLYRRHRRSTRLRRRHPHQHTRRGNP